MSVLVPVESLELSSTACRTLLAVPAPLPPPEDHWRTNYYTAINAIAPLPKGSRLIGLPTWPLDIS